MPGEGLLTSVSGEDESSQAFERQSHVIRARSSNEDGIMGRAGKPGDMLGGKGDMGTGRTTSILTCTTGAGNLETIIHTLLGT